MKPTALLTTIASDSHSWNLVFMELLLQENGFDVINLGPCTPIEMIARAIKKHDFNLLVVSTVNGHGVIEAPSILGAIGPQVPPAIIGGKLDTGSSSCAGTARTALIRAGFDEVFEDHCKNVFDDFQTYLNTTNTRRRPQAAASKKIQLDPRACHFLLEGATL